MGFFDPILEHINRVKSLSPEELWESAGTAAKNVMHFPQRKGGELLDEVLTKGAKAVFGTGMGEEAFTLANRWLSKSEHWHVPEKAIKVLESHPTLALAASVGVVIPSFVSLAKHLGHWAHGQAIDESRNRAHSHQTLESATGQQTKNDLNLPYKTHSQIDLPKLVTFFDTLAEKYPALFGDDGPLRENIRLYFHTRTRLLEQVTHHQWKPFSNLARIILYSEHLSKDMNIARGFSTRSIIHRVLKAIGHTEGRIGEEESDLGEIALKNISVERARFIKSAGLALGLVESALGLYMAGEHIEHWFGKHVSGPYEDTVQKQQDKVRAAEYKAWKREGKLGPRPGDTDDDDTLSAKIREETAEFLNPKGVLGKALDLVIHPGRHSATLFGGAAFAAIGIAQFIPQAGRLWKQDGNFLKSAMKTVNSKEWGEFFRGGHTIRTWGMFGAAGIFNAFQSSNVESALGGFGGLVATMISDVALSRGTHALMKKAYFQDVVREGMRRGFSWHDKFFNLEPGQELNIPFVSAPIHEAREKMVVLDEIAAFRKSGQVMTDSMKQQMSQASRDITTLAQETVGPLLELLLFPLATQALKGVGRFIDRKRAKGRAKRRIHAHAVAQQNEQQDAFDDEHVMNPSENLPHDQSPGTQYSYAGQRPADTKSRLSIHTHTIHADEPIDERKLNQGRIKDNRRGAGNWVINYSSTYN